MHHKEQDSHTNPQTNGQTANINRAIDPIAEQISDSNSQEIKDHLINTFFIYSLRKFSTGFARPARQLRDNTVPNATSNNPKPETANTHHDSSVR